MSTARSRRCRLAFVLLLLLTSPTWATTFGQTIVTAVAPKGDFKLVVDDLAAYLQRIAGQPFQQQLELADACIVVAGVEELTIPEPVARQLAGKGRQAFVVQREGDRLWIVGNTVTAAGYGVYAYLEHLGVRFLLPTDAWTIVPAREDLDPRQTLCDEPTFDIRGFFATGGFGGKLPLDPDRNVQATWEAWQRRLRYGTLMKLGGHAGEDFNSRNKAVLEQHPEYLAEVDGQRPPLGQITKPCYSNPDMLALYVKDRVAKLGEQIKQSGDGPGGWAVSVDPADGGGHCRCAGCQKIGSISDGVFTFANAVAREVQKQYPGRLVNLYGYNDHAFPPSIPVEPNVYIMLVPYGLHRTGLSPEQFIAAWSNKSPHMGVYGYWSLTDWSNDQPDFDCPTRVARDIRYWHTHGLHGASLQSTASAGAIGRVMYLASKLLWHPDADENAVLAEFDQLAFGAAAEPTGRMLARWGAGFLLSEQELALSFADLQQAYAATDDPAIIARLDDLTRYVQYLRLWLEYQTPKARTPERHEAADRLLAYMWRIYDSTMVHVYRMSVLMTARYENYDQPLRDAWDLKKSDRWASITPCTRAELAEMRAAGVRDYRPLPIDRPRFSKDYVRLSTQATAGAQEITTPSMGLSGTFLFEGPPGARQVTLQISTGSPTADYPGDTVTIFDHAGQQLHHQRIPPDRQWHDITVELSGAAPYRLEVFDQKAIYRLKAPANVPLTLISGLVSTDVLRRIYFYVPRGAKYIGIYNESVVPLKVWDPQDKQVETTGSRMVVVRIPRGQDGQVWSLGNFKSWSPIHLFGAPPAFSMTPEALYIPRELKEKR